MDPLEKPLNRLVKAARQAPAPEVEAPPEAEVNSLRERVRATLLTLTWRRVSLFAALIAGIAFVIFYFMVRDDEPKPATAEPGGLDSSSPIPNFPEAP